MTKAGRANRVILHYHQRAYRAGFRYLIPIIPPGATLAPGSTITEGSRGKAPGLLGPNGWTGFPKWADHGPVTLQDVQHWDKMQAGLGHVTGLELCALDGDLVDPRLAVAVKTMLAEQGVHGPVRTGQAPKWLMMFRVKPGDLITSWQIVGEDRLGTRHNVQMIGAGGQFVGCGTHPKTGQPYAMELDLYAPEAGPGVLPEMTTEISLRVQELVRDKLVSEGVTLGKGQAAGSSGQFRGKRLWSMRGLEAPSAEQVEKLMTALPNPHSIWPTRASFLNVLQAVRGALNVASNVAPYHGLALGLCLDWAARWDGGVNDPDDVQKMFDNCAVSRTLGWPYLVDKARGLGVDLEGLGIRTGDDFPDDLGDEADVLSRIAGDLLDWLLSQRNARPTSARLVAFFDRETVGYDWDDPGPCRPWLYSDCILRGELSFVAGRGAVSKTQLLLVEAVSMVLGQELLARVYEPRLVVAHFQFDEDRRELQRRLTAILRAYGLSGDVGVRMALEDGLILGDRSFARRLQLVRPGDRGRLEPDFRTIQTLAAWCRSKSVDVLQLDPLTNLMMGGENDNSLVTAVLSELLVALGEGVALVVAHHVRKGSGTSPAGQGGQDLSMDDLRGASALANRARSARMLQELTETGARKMFGSDLASALSGRAGGVAPDKLVSVFDVKNNFAPPRMGARDWYHLEGVSLGNADAWRRADVIGVPKLWTPPSWTVSDGDLQVVWDRVARGPVAGQRYSPRAGAGNRTLNAMADELGWPLDRVQGCVRQLIREGSIGQGTYQDPVSRKVRPCLETKKSRKTIDELDPFEEKGVFDNSENPFD